MSIIPIRAEPKEQLTKDELWIIWTDMKSVAIRNEKILKEPPLHKEVRDKVARMAEALA